ncbi:uncharacterized protein LAESUDRAFT_724767 [Laetiporus sulphureus 93-53]|uniref:Uncharacterized protein n=1 Tax=Laetiporus sulphureus 93-53 TaxID=1314785 RepID=A0A165EU79_9APHY|nr:uncharacterized protein LAESUDRAFT_724767 [Laetiporus sulphureus 93-53]KZT07771.1 hypothetical protein LAESUDRAFT_724767 [Laetiporus sulphureus 93-53]
MVSPLPVRQKITTKPVCDSGAGQANANKFFKDTSPMGGAHSAQDHRTSKSSGRTSVSRDLDLQKPTRASQVISGSQHSFASPSQIQSRVHSCKVASSSDCTRSTSTVWDAGLDATSRLSRRALAAYIFSLPLDESDVSDIEKPSDILCPCLLLCSGLVGLQNA